MSYGKLVEWEHEDIKKPARRPVSLIAVMCVAQSKTIITSAIINLKHIARKSNRAFRATDFYCLLSEGDNRVAI